MRKTWWTLDDILHVGKFNKFKYIWKVVRLGSVMACWVRWWFSSAVVLKMVYSARWAGARRYLGGLLGHIFRRKAWGTITASAAPDQSQVTLGRPLIWPNPSLLGTSGNFKSFRNLHSEHTGFQLFPATTMTVLAGTPAMFGNWLPQKTPKHMPRNFLKSWTDS